MKSPAILGAAAWLLAGAAACMGPPQREVTASTGFEGDGLTYGLFIGIDRYPRMEGQDLHGCVNDAVSMQQLFQQRFGVEQFRLLTDEQATRQGIQRAFRDLVEAVRARGEDLGPEEVVSVVLTYAGHGSQVDNQPADEEDEPLDGKDESWVAYDSTFATGENDVRDDEIEAVWAELLGLGAQVLLISDSCHSGTMHRGQEFGKARALEPADGPRPGPAEDLFPEWQRPAPATGDAPPANPGFVLFSACRDNEIARETVDDEGYPCGRLTWTLRRVLADLPGNATYQDVYQEVVEGFDREWPNRTQSPQIHAGAGKVDERFLRGGFPPLHASLREIDGNRARLDMGRAHGVTRDATFELYGSLDDLERRQDLRGTARVVGDVELSRCWVELEDGVPDAAWKARLARVRNVEFPIRLGPGVPEAVRQALEELADEGQVHLTTGHHRLVVTGTESPASVRIFAPEEVPDPERGLDPAPLLQVDGGGPDAAEVVARWILDRARVQRLLSLQAGSDLLAARVAGSDPGEDGPGVPRLRDQESFQVQIQNRSEEDLYLHVLGFDADPAGGDGLARSVFVVYPFQGFVHDPLEAGDTYVIDLTAHAGPEVKRHLLKVIAAPAPLNLTRLMQSRGSEEAAGVESPQARGLDDVLSGVTGQTRGAGDATWGTDTVVFEVEALGPADGGS